MRQDSADYLWVRSSELLDGQLRALSGDFSSHVLENVLAGCPAATKRAFTRRVERVLSASGTGQEPLKNAGPAAGNRLDPYARLEHGFIRLSQRLREVTRATTRDLTGWVLNTDAIRNEGRARNAFLDYMVGFVADPDPDGSLHDSARHPFPFYREEFVSGRMTPLAKWRQLEKWSGYWPKNVRKHSRLLGVGTGRLPTWRRIERFFESVGFKAIPVRGYIGAPLYGHMVGNRLAPVCTQWVLRYRRAPYYLLPTDTFHDLGHGLAMAMDDYRDLLVRFARASLGTGRYLLSLELDHYYGRLFEHACALRGDGLLEPIGAGPMAFESNVVRGGKLRSIVRDECMLASQKHGYRPFGSREEWREETRAFISGLNGRRGAGSTPR